MVSNRRRHAILTALGLYTFAALFIGYFAVNAYTGNHGLRAKQDLDQQIAALNAELKQSQSRACACGNGGSRCCNPTASTPTCWTSAPALCWAMPIRAI